MLFDSVFFGFSHSEMVCFLYLLSIASKANSGTVTVNYEHANHFLKLSKRVVSETINKLNELQIVTVDVTDTLRKSNGDVTSTNATDGRTDEHTRSNFKNSTEGVFDFELVYQKYPRKQGKAEAMARLPKIIKTQQDYDDFCCAVVNYAIEQDRLKTEMQHIKHFSSFVGTEAVQPWRDWVDYNPPVSIKKKIISSACLG